MMAKIIPIKNFLKEAKPLTKKYRSLRKELEVLTDDLVENPRQGTKIKEDTYKIRLAVKSKGRGKSGGMRVITFIHEVVEQADGEIVVYLISIYDKSDIANISDKYLTLLIDDVVANIQIEVATKEQKNDEDSGDEK